MNRIYGLKCEYRDNPNQIDIRNPRFSWKVEAEEHNVMQVQWKIKVKEADINRVVWEFQKNSNQSFHIEYAGDPLSENKKYLWNVESTLNDGRILTAQEPVWFETGLFSADRWRGIWIGKKDREELGNCPLFRKSFISDENYQRARIFISARGLYELSVNGKVQDDYLLTPGWTNYNHHLQYVAYDVTGVLRKGENVIGIRLGDGWYSGEISFNHQTHVYGEAISVAAILVIEYDSGEQIITTDSSWKTTDSGILRSAIYDGEIYDLTKEEMNWNCPGYDDSKWQQADPMEDPPANMSGMLNEGTKRIEIIRPKQIIQTPNGDTLVDMGQNMTGWLRITLDGKAGEVVHIKHAEVLDKNGNFYSGNIRLAKQEDRYTLRDGQNILEPHFTFHGFRYVKILEFPQEIKKEFFEGIVLHTDMKPTIQFESSNPLINQLHHNLVWGQKGNFLDVPTDCPQRDERLGWTGDAQIFCRTACYNFGADAFFTKWLEDVKADQYDNGAIPFVVPDVLPRDWRFLTEAKLGYAHVSAAWGDAITICPWALYLQYGDNRILDQSYNNMKQYIDYIYDGAKHGSGNPYLWDWGPQLGDWLALDSEEGSYRGATDETYIATAYYAYSTRILYQTAEIIGRYKDQKHYYNLYQKIRDNFRATFVKEGVIPIDTQTAQLIPVYFGLLDEEETKNAVDKLVKLLKTNKEHLTTGFVGTPYLCHVLSEHGYNELAYTLLLQKDFPSWLYQVTKGATTVWEHWDGKKPDGTFWSDDMNSFNHYAYGSIGEWLYRQAAGIDTAHDTPGFAHIIIRPRSDARLSHICCIYESVSGRIKSEWRRENQKVNYHIEIPANTKATIYLEDGAVHEVGSGIYEYMIRVER